MSFFAAAGNDSDGTDSGWPASHPKVIAVAGHITNGELWSESDYQSYVEVSAPGAGIWTTDMVDTTSNGYYKGWVSTTDPYGECHWGSGTSYASPAVAGVAALLLSIDSSLSPLEIRSIINLCQHPILDSNGIPRNDLSFGRIDAYWAVLEAKP